MQIVRRLEKIEGALVGEGIPNAERLQVIKGKMTEGRFIPDTPRDSVETRRQYLIRRFGNADGAVFIKLIDSFGS
jgi:hypothetical protein